MPRLLAAAVLAGIVMVFAADTTHPGSLVTMAEILAAPSNYVGNAVSIAGKITKLENDGNGGDSFLITVDNALQAQVNVRVAEIERNE